MTKRVQQIIDDIRSKYIKVYESMLAEKKKSIALLEELKAYETKTAQVIAKNHQLEQIVEEVKIELETALLQGKESIQSAGLNRNEEIDELVREIEHCISQLKQ
jgi:site-specific DNA-adenine methylase